MMEANTKIDPFTVVLGIAQDGGVPHIGTNSPAWNDPSLRRSAASLGIVDPATGERWMIEATPDIKTQLHLLQTLTSGPPSFSKRRLGGVLITHAHVGHYLGLASLGKEMLDVRGLPIYVMPTMRNFLLENLPWRDLVKRGNILLHELQANRPQPLNDRIRITPIPVPHRYEYSETVGLRIEGPNRSVLFIPDIDRWEDWDAWGEQIEDHIARVDIAYLDGTFFSERELPGRDMSLIPHPTVDSSMHRFVTLPDEERRKIRFIHLNHSNPLLDPHSPERRRVEKSGFAVADELERMPL